MMDKEIIKSRYKSIRKANELIQQSRFDLSTQQQKVVLYLISQISPADEDFKECEFDIIDFCKVCGIDYDSGRNYEMLKTQIKKIADKSIWVKLGDDEVETLLRWIEKPYINKRSGKIRIKLDEDMKPFLLQLRKNYTQYELIYTLHFKSKYSIRLYELIKSIHYNELETYKRFYTIEEIRNLLGVEDGKLLDFKNLKARVLSPAIEEINLYSDKVVVPEWIKKVNKVVGVEITISSKEIQDRMNVLADIEREMNGQISFFDDEK